MNIIICRPVVPEGQSERAEFQVTSWEWDGEEDMDWGNWYRGDIQLPLTWRVREPIILNWDSLLVS